MLVQQFHLFIFLCSASLQENKDDPPTATDTKLNSEAAAKKIKNLKKKLRQIDELQAKVDSGELKELTNEQKEKLRRKTALLNELKELE